MFLEETIDSLDTEADSGVSADETDYAEHSNLPGTWPKRDVVPKSKIKTCVLNPRELIALCGQDWKPWDKVNLRRGGQKVSLLSSWSKTW